MFYAIRCLRLYDSLLLPAVGHCLYDLILYKGAVRTLAALFPSVIRACSRIAAFGVMVHDGVLRRSCDYCSAVLYPIFCWSLRCCFLVTSGDLFGGSVVRDLLFAFIFFTSCIICLACSAETFALGGVSQCGLS
jgi:hypothetical protein